MLTGMMTYDNFLFWYVFIVSWFFLAAAVVYFVVIKDGIDSMKSKINIKISQDQLSPITLEKNKNV